MFKKISPDNNLISTFISTSRRLLVGRRTIPCNMNKTDKIDINNIISLKNNFVPSVGRYEKVEDVVFGNLEYKNIYFKDIIIPSEKIGMEGVVLAKEAAKIEDFLIFQGENKDGLLYKAGNRSTKPLDFLTVGNATEAINIGTNLLIDDGYDSRLGFDLILNETQYNELLSARYHTGQFEINHAREMLSGGNIYCTEIPHGVGLLIPSMSHQHNYFNININTDWGISNRYDNLYRIAVSLDADVDTDFMLCRLDNI